MTTVKCKGFESSFINIISMVVFFCSSILFVDNIYIECVYTITKRHDRSAVAYIR
jgi:hypothetical protein